MIKLWSEVSGARLREQAADLATVLWVVLWVSVAWQLFQFLAGFATAGRAIQDSGQAMVQSGRDLGDALLGVPFVGAQLHDAAREAFAAPARPLTAFGFELERFIIVVSVVLALVIAVVTLVPWLSRYLPWRAARLRRVRAAHRAIRIAPGGRETSVERVLAMRAVTRLDYATLLEYTPDPLGDWAAGRHDRLARAELASVGLRP